MSIDMQFSFLSNDLASAKQSEAKVRGTDGGCGDKGFGDVFDEQLQQATEPEQNSEISQSILLTGQEVAAMLTDNLEAAAQAAGASLDADSAASIPGASSADLAATSQQLVFSPAGSEAFNSAESLTADGKDSTNQSADDAAALFQLIAKARDYAADLEAVVPKDQARQSTAAELAKLNPAGDSAGQALMLTDEQAVLPIDPLLMLAQSKDKNAETQQSDLATQLQTAVKQQGLSTDAQVASQDPEQKTQITSVEAHHISGQLMSQHNIATAETASSSQLLQPQQQDKSTAELFVKDVVVDDKTAAIVQSAVSDKNAEASPEPKSTLSAEQLSAAATKNESLVFDKATAENQQGSVVSVRSISPVPQPNIESAPPVERTQFSAVSNTLQAELALTEVEQADLSGALLTPTLSAGAAVGKNNSKAATQGFAEFQKTANAALAQQQKQQTEAQQQYGQQGTVQGESTTPELTLVQPGVVPHDQPQIAATLVATEKALSGNAFNQTGSQSGGQSQHQSQQGFSQILAAKQLDSQTQNQPSLSLLEPTAANQLKERVMFQVNQKIQSADIRLAPEELGSVQIKINLQQEQLSVQFVVQQSAAKEALEQQMPRLKELLQEQGMALTEGQVHQQQQEQQSQQDDRRTASGRTGAHTTQDDEAEVAAQQVQVSVSDRMVDYYA